LRQQIARMKQELHVVFWFGNIRRRDYVRGYLRGRVLWLSLASNMSRRCIEHIRAQPEWLNNAALSGDVSTSPILPA
jgi:hypothetical protein